MNVKFEELNGVVIYNFFLISLMEIYVFIIYLNILNIMMLMFLIIDREESFLLGVL